MRWIVFLPGFLGLASVLQSALNRQFARSWGLSSAVLINTLVFLVLSLGFSFAVRPPSRGSFQWWFVLPGMLGFCLVAGMPWAIARMGAFSAYVGLIAGQLLTGLVWDAVAEGMPVTPIRGLGALLMLASVALIAFKK